jgi:hypothetical protein
VRAADGLIGGLDAEKLNALSCRFGNDSLVEEIHDVEIRERSRRILKSPESGEMSMARKDFGWRFWQTMRRQLEIVEKTPIPCSIVRG